MSKNKATVDQYWSSLADMYSDNLSSCRIVKEPGIKPIALQELENWRKYDTLVSSIELSRISLSDYWRG